MTYDPTITQRVRKAIMDATDSHLAVEMLLEYNDQQDKQIERLVKQVTELEWHNRRRVTEERVRIVVQEALKETKLKIGFNKWVLIFLGIPVASAAITFVIDIVKTWK